jgi:hypothetical protein
MQTLHLLAGPIENTAIHNALDTPITVDYNLRLKQVADSTMKSFFGEQGFAQNFTMTCLQNPCAPGYLYANTGTESSSPCTTQPQNTCKEAIITYSYVKNDVPLRVKMLVLLKDNGDYIYVENNQYGAREISLKQQNLLSMSEIQAILSRNYPKAKLNIISGAHTLVYSFGRVREAKPRFNVKSSMQPYAVYKVLRETKAGKKWQGGFLYTAVSLDPKKSQEVYHFDATNGKLLWITKMQRVSN